MDTKTARSRREVPIDSWALSQLREHRKTQSEHALLLGPGWNRAEPFLDLICERGDGGPIDPDNFYSAFKRFGRQAGLDPRTRLHDVRHRFGQTLTEKGVPLVAASAVMGHSGTAFTANVYLHYSPRLAEMVTDALAQAYGR